MNIKNILNLLCITLLLACNQNNKEPNTTNLITANMNVENEKLQINAMLDAFNKAAGNADFNTYFNFYNEDAVFLGTDATEYWTKDEFMTWAKPRFEAKKTWNYTSLERNIYFDKTSNLAWFDELLNTQMKICRGSGVLIKEGDNWKIKQYVLSMTFPNSEVDAVLKLKSPIEDSLIEKLSKK